VRFRRVALIAVGAPVSIGHHVREHSMDLEGRD
jgi:hypothetical protein